MNVAATVSSPHFEVTKMQANDLRELIMKKGRTYVTTIGKEEERAFEECKYSYTIKVDGAVALCGGLTEYWPGRAESWVVLDPKCKPHFLILHNMVKRFLEICPVRRIEAAVDCEFVPGHRWVRSLGFELDAKRLRGYLPDGKDVSLYSFVKKERS